MTDPRTRQCVRHADDLFERDVIGNAQEGDGVRTRIAPRGSFEGGRVRDFVRRPSSGRDRGVAMLGDASLDVEVIHVMPVARR